MRNLTILPLILLAPFVFLLNGVNSQPMPEIVVGCSSTFDKDEDEWVCKCCEWTHMGDSWYDCMEPGYENCSQPYAIDGQCPDCMQVRPVPEDKDWNYELESLHTGTVLKVMDYDIETIEDGVYSITWEPYDPDDG